MRSADDHAPRGLPALETPGPNLQDIDIYFGLYVTASCGDFAFNLASDFYLADKKINRAVINGTRAAFKPGARRNLAPLMKRGSVQLTLGMFPSGVRQPSDQVSLDFVVFFLSDSTSWEP